MSFATKVALNAYSIPSWVKNGDFTYVLDDETKNGATTRYIWTGSAWQFTFVIDYDPVGIANTETLGLVKSSTDSMGTWTSRTSAADNDWRSVCYGNGLFVAVSSSGTGNRVMTSPTASLGPSAPPLQTTWWTPSATAMDSLWLWPTPVPATAS